MPKLFNFLSLFFCNAGIYCKGLLIVRTGCGKAVEAGIAAVRMCVGMQERACSRSSEQAKLSHKAGWSSNQTLVNTSRPNPVVVFLPPVLVVPTCCWSKPTDSKHHRRDGVQGTWHKAFYVDINWTQLCRWLFYPSWHWIWLEPIFSHLSTTSFLLLHSQSSSLNRT